MTLDEVRRLAREHHVRELPGFVAYGVLDELITRHKGRRVCVARGVPWLLSSKKYK